MKIYLAHKIILLFATATMGAAVAQIPAPRQAPSPTCGVNGTLVDYQMELRSEPMFVDVSQVTQLCRNMENDYNNRQGSAAGQKKAYLLSEWPTAMPTIEQNIYIYTCYFFTCKF